MAKLVPVVCDGNYFPSVAALCAFYGVERFKAHSRIHRGWTPEEAVGLVARATPGNGAKPVELDGMHYESITVAAKTLGIKPATVAARIAKGYSVEDALRGKLKIRISHRANSVEFRGQIFQSQEELAAYYGLHRSLPQKRIKRGWTMEQALGLESPPPRFRNFEGHARDQKWKEVRITDGKVEPVPDAQGYKLYLITNTVNSKVYVGLTVGPLANRLKQHFAAARRGRKSAFYNTIRKHGETVFNIELLINSARTYDELQVQEVLEIEKRDSIRSGYNTAKGGSLGTAKELTVVGRIFQSYLEAAEHYQVHPMVLSVRLTRLKWTPEEAVGLAPREWVGKEVSVLVEGKHYQSIRNAAECYGVEYKLVHERYRTRGWTIEQSLGLSHPPESSKYGGASVSIFDKVYESFGEAGRALGVNPESFRKRVQSGMSPEEAYQRARKKVAPS